MNTAQYLALSQLAYEDLSEAASNGYSIEALIKRGTDDYYNDRTSSSDAGGSRDEDIKASFTSLSLTL